MTKEKNVSVICLAGSVVLAPLIWVAVVAALGFVLWWVIYFVKISEPAWLHNPWVRYGDLAFLVVFVPLTWYGWARKLYRHCVERRGHV